MGIEKLRIELNNHPYDRDMIFASVGFGGGVLTRNYVVNNKEEFVGNYAFCNVLFNYLRLTSDDIVGLNFDVQRTSSSITFNVKSLEFVSTLNKVLNKLFDFEYNEEKFNLAKDNTKNAFGLRYKDVAFRAKYKAYEFSDLNKRFTLLELIKDIENITFESFVANAKVLIVPGNICVYAVGNTNDISKEQLNSINIPNFESYNTVSFNSQPYDAYLRQDAHLMNLAREDYQLTVEAFDFLNPSTTVFTKRFITEIFAETLNMSDFEVYADGTDASILFPVDVLSKKKDSLIHISEDEYKKAHQKLVSKYIVLIKKSPEIFATLGVSLMLLGIYIDQYMSFMANCTYEMFVEICEKADFKISEAQLVFRKGEK